MSDFGDLWLRGTQVGAGIMGDALNRDLRYQELKSMDAMRRAEEAQLAQQTAFALEQHNRQIQYRADMEKAAGQLAVATASQGPPIVPVPVGMGPAGMPIMAPVSNPKYRDPVDVATDSFLPVISKYEPEKVPAFLREQAYSKIAAGSVIRQEAYARRQTEAAEAQSQLLSDQQAHLKAQTDLLKAQTKNVEEGGGKTGVDPEWIRGLKFMNDLRRKAGQPEYTPEETEKLFRVHAGIDARAAVTRPAISRSQYVDKHIERFAADNPRMKRSEAIAALQTEYDKLDGEAPAGRVRRYDPTTGKLQ